MPTDTTKPTDAELDAMLTATPNAPATAAPARTGNKTTAKTAPRKATAKPADEGKHEPVVDKVLTDTPGRKTVRIMIDDVDGKANNEVVGINGKVYQIRRGEPVEVPLEVLHALENAVQTKTVQTVDRVTGEVVNNYKDSSAIPWRRV
jgi:hypothetical protein